MRYTRSGIGLLNAQYRSVLKKCFLINLGLFVLGAGVATAEDFALKADNLSTSKNITWKEIDASQYDPNDKNMLKVDLSDSKSQYFKFTYTKPEGGTVYDTRKEGKEGALSGDITADFKDITSNVDGGALYNTAGNTLNITGDFINNLIDNTSNNRGYYGGAIINEGILSIKGDMIGNSIVRDEGVNKGAYGGAIINNSASANISEIIGNFIGNHLISNSFNAYGGAIFNADGATISKIGGKFIGNYALGNENDAGKIGAGGGAIYNLSSKIENISSDFINNYAKNITGLSQAAGGAIANTKSSIGSITGNFTGNYAESEQSSAYGGAITNFNSSSIGNITGDFFNNYTASEQNFSYGGAIYNGGSSIGNISGDFTSNYAKSEERFAYGGAIYNSNSSVGDIIGNFTDNYVQSTNESVRGGAIYNYNLIKIGNIKGDFTGNHAKSEENFAYGGAIINRNTTIDSVTGNFTNNYTISKNHRADGGAIYNINSTINNIKDNFTNNYTLSGGQASGGAINNNNASVINQITSDFSENYAESNGGNDIARGGAILNLSVIKSITGNFTNNCTLTNGTFSTGGAIFNNYFNTASKGITTLSGNFDGNYAKTTGTGNDAYAQGGAIYNSANMNIYDIQSATFNNNYVSGASEQTDGGAIWNAGNLGFNGSNVFKDNYKIVNGEKTANDIYNSGTISVAENGSISVNGGITGSNGTINLAENAILNINDATVSGNNLTLEKDATLAFNVNEVNTANTVQSGGKVDGNIKLNADANLKVSIYVEHGADSGESTYKFADTVDTADGKWKLNTVIANGLYNYDFKLNDDSNTLIMEFAKKNADDIADEFNTSKDKADEILALVSPKSDNDQFNNISETVDKLAQASDKNLPNALDDLNDNTQANLETGRYMGDIIAKNVADRYDTHLDTGNAYGLSSGDVSEYEPEVWANAVYQSAENSGDWDYSADTKGVIAAVDGKAGQNWTLGAGYSYLQTDLDSGAKSSDVDDHAVFAYAEYSRSSWFANGLASYHWLSFDQNKKAFGENIKGSFDMQMLGLQAMVGKEFYGCAENHFMRLRPQVGVRYYKISQDGYADSAGMSYNDADSDVVTGVAGVSFTDETKVNGYYVMPKAFVNATYDLQNDDNTTVVNLPNGGSYAIAQESNGKFGIETGVGVEMKLTRQAKVGLTYEYDWRDDYSAHTGLLNLKYAF